MPAATRCGLFRADVHQINPCFWVFRVHSHCPGPLALGAETPSTVPGVAGEEVSATRSDRLAPHGPPLLPAGKHADIPQ